MNHFPTQACRHFEHPRALTPTLPYFHPHHHLLFYPSPLVPLCLERGDSPLLSAFLHPVTPFRHSFLTLQGPNLYTTVPSLHTFPSLSTTFPLLIPFILSLTSPAFIASQSNLSSHLPIPIPHLPQWRIQRGV